MVRIVVRYSCVLGFLRIFEEGGMSMSEAMERLHREHKEMAKLLGVIERQLEGFVEDGEIDYDLVRTALGYMMEYPDLYHHPKEDLILAKLVLRNPEAVDEIGDLESKHQELAQLTKDFNSAVEDALNEVEMERDLVSRRGHAYVDALRRHIAMEEAGFLPAAKAHLTAEDWAEIDAMIANPEDPLFGPEVSESYLSLIHEITE